jgi:hypothetical protein
LDGHATTVLHAAGQPIPAPILARGLIDTGSNASSVAPWILRRLGVARGVIRSTRTAGGVAQVHVHYLSLAILDAQQTGSLSYALPTVLASEMPSLLPDADVLVGLNVLRTCKFALDGPANSFLLDF